MIYLSTYLSTYLPTWLASYPSICLSIYLHTSHVSCSLYIGFLASQNPVCDWEHPNEDVNKTEPCGSVLLVVVRLAVEVIELLIVVVLPCFGGRCCLSRTIRAQILKTYKNVISVRGNSKGSHPKTGDDFHFFTLVAVPLCGFHKPAGI